MKNDLKLRENKEIEKVELMCFGNKNNSNGDLVNRNKLASIYRYIIKEHATNLTQKTSFIKTFDILEQTNRSIVKNVNIENITKTNTNKKTNNFVTFIGEGNNLNRYNITGCNENNQDNFGFASITHASNIDYGDNDISRSITCFDESCDVNLYDAKKKESFYKENVTLTSCKYIKNDTVDFDGNKQKIPSNNSCKTSENSYPNQIIQDNFNNSQNSKKNMKNVFVSSNKQNKNFGNKSIAYDIYHKETHCNLIKGSDKKILLIKHENPSQSTKIESVYDPLELENKCINIKYTNLLHHSEDYNRIEYNSKFNTAICRCSNKILIHENKTCFIQNLMNFYREKRALKKKHVIISIVQSFYVEITIEIDIKTDQDALKTILCDFIETNKCKYNNLFAFYMLHIVKNVSNYYEPDKSFLNGYGRKLIIFVCKKNPLDLEIEFKTEKYYSCIYEGVNKSIFLNFFIKFDDDARQTSEYERLQTYEYVHILCRNI
ncbi:hypothetical protein COBT_001139 [Conglomerata obtusa]